ncbi:hypothetical protein I5Q34_16510 [Streptomyces sp. AV19]|uniref:hypothetical protein n=1 Tax=Streptomyces sp. AV19 TaxID=2793068 RepID=UPI0018FEAECB|nr:hypothetical protein [Streptomyces sp. AV19]MBH1935850.1 hypothetical protein [Streptomyces sp. AV19]MDG4534366.1 hypothetical protein [Streptomyces sp. AV19]
MHFHGYLWVGDKADFDRERVRRPPSSVEPTGTSSPDVLERYREAVAEWRVTDVPPLEVAYWLVRPARLIRGTWDHPKPAADWAVERLAEYAPRFASPAERNRARCGRRGVRIARALTDGQDVSVGYYLARPHFLSLALVSCSPNRAVVELPCPAQRESMSL